LGKQLLVLQSQGFELRQFGGLLILALSEKAMTQALVAALSYWIAWSWGVSMAKLYSYAEVTGGADQGTNCWAKRRMVDNLG
jgi:hypothetical protein